jgi:hypothetical protein
LEIRILGKKHTRKEKQTKAKIGLPNAGFESQQTNFGLTHEQREFLRIKINTLKLTSDSPDFIWEIIGVLQKHFFVVLTSRLINIENGTYLLYSQIFPKEGNATKKPRSFNLELTP